MTAEAGIQDDASGCGTTPPTAPDRTAGCGIEAGSADGRAAAVTAAATARIVTAPATRGDVGRPADRRCAPRRPRRDPVVSNIATCEAVGRAAGSSAVIAWMAVCSDAGRPSGTPGGRCSRAVADSTSAPGYSRRPVSASSSTSPRA